MRDLYEVLYSVHWEPQFFSIKPLGFCGSIRIEKCTPMRNLSLVSNSPKNLE